MAKKKVVLKKSKPLESEVSEMKDIEVSEDNSEFVFEFSEDEFEPMKDKKSNKKIKKKKSMKKKGEDIFLTILLFVFLVIFCISGCKLFIIWQNYQKGTNTYESIQKEVKKNKIVDFDKLKKQNPDVVGWIYSKDTVIDYPIVQGSDNSYYLHHLFNGESNSSGTIFLDYTKNKDFSSKNSIIYGHHMRNGSMFASLMGYKDQDYYDSHKTLTLYTPNGNYKAKPLYGFVVEAKDWEDKGFSSDGTVTDLLNYASKRTTFSSSISYDSDSQFLTLYTCSYEIDDGRYVLICKLEKEK